MKRLAMIAALLACAVDVSHAAKVKLPVKIVGSQTTEGASVYSVPGYASTNCALAQFANGPSSQCQTFTTVPESFTYPIEGATLSLLLPDARIVVVTCDKKLNWTGSSSEERYRSCRIPTGIDLTAEFDGDHAKLEWIVSIERTKKASETYKIVAVLAKMPEK